MFRLNETFGLGLTEQSTPHWMHRMNWSTINIFLVNFCRELRNRLGRRGLGPRTPPSFASTTIVLQDSFVQKHSPMQGFWPQGSKMRLGSKRQEKRKVFGHIGFQKRIWKHHFDRFEKTLCWTFSPRRKKHQHTYKCLKQSNKAFCDFLHKRRDFVVFHWNKKKRET